MKQYYFFFPVLAAVLLLLAFDRSGDQPASCIRINQPRYTPQGMKVAVPACKNDEKATNFALRDATNGRIVFYLKFVSAF